MEVTLGEQSLAIQSALQKLHQQLAMIDATEAPGEETQWTGVPEAIVKVLIMNTEESKEGEKEDQRAAQHPQ
ncbi:hypothetical protein NDU88_001589 [Pleurodeles waltl]|uniref:Uncharacterized protein n=1 Tax=Pleurodeles waltl TaxID=8319 RepID=A0AAV7S8G0_PLEWA|nr:hypothetical protein NDU88_001589 [Pleurodeles waltl]